MSKAGTISESTLPQDEEEGKNSKPNLPIENLLHENTALKSKLALSEDQRVIEDITRNQIQSFLAEATHGQVRSNDKLHTTTTSLSEVLQKLCEEKTELEAELQRTRFEATETLSRIDELKQERQVLQTRLQEFEMRVNNIPLRPHEVELEQLRQSEALLRQQLKSAQEENVVMVDKLKKLFEEELAVLPMHIEKAEAAKAALQESCKAQAYLQVKMEEQRKRFETLHEFHESRAEDARLLHRQEMLAWKQLLGAALERERILVKGRATLEAQIATGVQRAPGESKPAHDDAVVQEGEERGSFAKKRQRIEKGQHPQSDESIRIKYVRFWHDGHARVAALEQRVCELESTEAAARVLQGRVAQLERDRTNLTTQLVNLADALSKAREANHQLRAQYVGLEIERDQLLVRLTEALGAAMQPGELAACSSAIREAATRQSATSATTMTDPEGLQQAMRQTRELKNEIVQLQRQKENLLRCITLREERVTTLLKREAMLVVEGNPCSAAQAAHETSSFSNFLKLVEQSARDIFAANEVWACEPPGNFHPTSETKGESRHHASFLAIQQELNESQARLRDSHLKLQESKTECQRLATDLARAETEKGELLMFKNAIAGTLRTANITIESLTSRLAGQHAEYNSLLTLQRQTQAAFDHVFELYRAETQQVEGLRVLVQQERADLVELVRRETQAWLHTNDTATHEQPEAIKSVVDALEQLNAGMQDGILRAMLNNSAESTRCLATLVGFVRDQEERLEALQKAYAESTTRLAASLAEHVVKARAQWETQWRDKHLALEREYATLSRSVFVTRKLHEALEQVSVEVKTSANPPLLSSLPLEETATAHGVGAESLTCALTAAGAFLDTLRRSEEGSQDPNETVARTLPVDNEPSKQASHKNEDAQDSTGPPAFTSAWPLSIQKPFNEQRKHV